jgi:hypothetical protein
MRKREKPPEVTAFERAFGHDAGSTRGQGWGLEGDEAGYLDEEDEEFEEEAARSAPRAARPVSASPDRFSSLLVRVVLVLVALYAAYSLQSHSQRQYALGPISDGVISTVSYNAGWPLTYAQVDVQQVPLTNTNPTPSLHSIQPLMLLVDVLVLGLPLWLLLEATWLSWSLMLRRFGPQRFVRRLFALGFTGLLATLWLIGALALGGYLSLVKKPEGTPSTWPLYAWPALAPAIPGFNLASAVSSVLAIPANLWPQDVGIFLLVMGLPILLLTAVLYIFFCLIGRGLRRMSGRR